MNNITEVDELRNTIIEYAGDIKKHAEAIPAIYDALKLIADKYPDTHHDICLAEMVLEFDGISLLAEECGKYIREAKNLIERGGKEQEEASHE